MTISQNTTALAVSSERSISSAREFSSGSQSKATGMVIS